MARLLELDKPLVEQPLGLRVGGIAGQHVTQDFNRGVGRGGAFGDRDHVVELPLPFPFLRLPALGLFLVLERVMELGLHQLGARMLGVELQDRLRQHNCLGQVVATPMPGRLREVPVNFATLALLGFRGSLPSLCR